MKKNEKAITLIALVITIIVLLILAGVAIAALKNTGLIGKTKDAQLKSLKAEAEEKLKLLLYEYHIANAESGISLEDFLNEKLAKNEIEDVNITEEGIEIYIDGFYAIIDGNGNIIEGMQKAGIKPELTYTLSTTEANQDKVTIIVNAISKDENATIANIINPNNEEIAGNETSFEVTKNGLYKFTAVTSVGTKKSSVVEITNIKISKPVITVVQNGGYPLVTEYGINNGNSIVSIEYENNVIYNNLYSEDNGSTWKIYTSNISTNSNKILAKSVIKNDTSSESEIETIELEKPTDALPITGTKTNAAVELTSNGASKTMFFNVDPSVWGKSIKLYCSASKYANGIKFTYYKGEEIYTSTDYMKESKTVEIPSGVTKVKVYMLNNTVGNVQTCRFYIIELQNQPIINFEYTYPTLNQDGFVAPKANAILNYYNVFSHKLYSVNDEEFKEYSGENIILNEKDIIKAKGIYDNNNESLVAEKQFDLLGDMLVDDAYNNDNVNFAVKLTANGASKTMFFNVDSGAWEKDIKIYCSASKYASGIKLTYYKGDEIDSSTSYMKGTTTVKIPSGITKVKVYMLNNDVGNAQTCILNEIEMVK